MVEPGRDVPPPVDAPAPFGRRAFARLFDLVVVAVVAVPVLTLTLQDDDGGGVRFPIVVIVLYALLPAVYEARLLARSGATPGKRLSGLVVRGRAGGLPTPATALLRAVLTWSVPATTVLLLDGPVVAAVIVVIFGPAAVPRWGRDLPDLVTGTRVRFVGDVRDEPATTA